MDNNLYCLNLNGTLRWIFTANAALQTTPILYGSNSFVGSDDGRVYAVNRSSGEPVWTFTPGYSIHDVTNFVTTPIVSNIVASNGTIFVGANGTIYGLKTGTIGASPDVQQNETETSPLVRDTPTDWYMWIIVIIATLVVIVILYAVLRKK
jgi:outer membrane protein assembly factor BamB